MDRIDSGPSGYLISALINGILAFLIVFSCGILSYMDLPKDGTRAVIGSLLWAALIMGPIAFFHYGSYMKLRHQSTAASES